VWTSQDQRTEEHPKASELAIADIDWQSQNQAEICRFMITGCTIKKHTQLQIYISFNILKNTASKYDNFLYNLLQIYIAFNILKNTASN